MVSFDFGVSFLQVVVVLCLNFVKTEVKSISSVIIESVTVDFGRNKLAEFGRNNLAEFCVYSDFFEV